MIRTCRAVRLNFKVVKGSDKNISSESKFVSGREVEFLKGKVEILLWFPAPLDVIMQIPMNVILCDAESSVALSMQLAGSMKFSHKNKMSSHTQEQKTTASGN